MPVVVINPYAFAAAGGGGSPTWYESTASTDGSANNDTGEVRGAAVTVGQSGNATKVRVRMAFVNTTSTLKATIHSTSGTLLGSGSASTGGAASDVDVEITLAAPVAMTNGTTYHVAFIGSPSSAWASAKNSAASGFVSYETNYASFPIDPITLSPDAFGGWRVGIYVE